MVQNERNSYPFCANAKGFAKVTEKGIENRNSLRQSSFKKKLA